MPKGIKPKSAWKPGQSGNPSGRPKTGMTLTDILKNSLDKNDFIKKMIELAGKGHTKAIEIIWDRLEGKVKEEIEVDGEIEIIFKNLTKK